MLRIVYLLFTALPLSLSLTCPSLVSLPVTAQSGLLGKTWATTFAMLGFSGVNYLTISLDGLRVYNNVVAIAGTVCLPLVIEQCVVSVSQADGYWRVNYTQEPAFGRLASG